MIDEFCVFWVDGAFIGMWMSICRASNQEKGGSTQKKVEKPKGEMEKGEDLLSSLLREETGDSKARAVEGKTRGGRGGHGQSRMN